MLRHRSMAATVTVFSSEEYTADHSKLERDSKKILTAVHRCLPWRRGCGLGPFTTGVLRIAGAETAVTSCETLKLIWIIPAERGGACFLAHKFPFIPWRTIS